jgi:hypothetical protein
VISRTPVTLLAAASLAFGSGTLRAQQRDLAARLAPGFYAGAELGGTGYDNACDPAALSCDHTDGAGAAFGGYRFASRFAIELGGRHLGDARAVYPRLTSTNEVVGQVEGYDVSGLLRFPFGRAWEAYVRGGAYHADAHTRSPEFSTAEPPDPLPSRRAGSTRASRPPAPRRSTSSHL